MTKQKKRIRDPDTGQWISEYKPEYAKLLLQHLSDGYSYESFAGVADVSRATIYTWEKEHEDFKEAKERGVAKAVFFWEKIGLAGTLGKVKNFNTTSWIFTMKNRFGWRDRHEIKNLGDGEEFVSHDKIMEYIERKKF